MPTHTVAAGAARALVQFAVETEVPEATLLAHAALTPADLRTDDARLALPRFVRLLRAAAALAGDAAFALRFGERFDLADLSIVSLVGFAAPTIREAFDAVNAYARLEADLPADREQRYAMEHGADGLWLIDRRASPNETPELTESSVDASLVDARLAQSSPLAGRILRAHADRLLHRLDRAGSVRARSRRSCPPHGPPAAATWTRSRAGSP